MVNRDVDTDVIREQLKKLIELRDKCIGYSKEQREENSKEQGSVHTALDEACVVMTDTWKEFIILINKTIEFLGTTTDAYEQSDQQSANEISSGKTSFGGGSGGGGFR